MFEIWNSDSEALCLQGFMFSICNSSGEALCL
jgi:hypothetical protein